MQLVLVPLLAILLQASAVSAAAPLLPPLQLLTTPNGVKFGLLLPPGAAKPYDLLIPLAADLNTTLIPSTHSDPFYPAYYSNSCADLIKAGWACASLDLPSHGAQVRFPIDFGLSHRFRLVFDRFW